MSGRFRLGRNVIIAAAASTVAACASTVENNGHILRGSAINELQPGVQDRETVAQLLGSPSSRAPFDDNVWYYVGQTTGTTAFFAPEMIDRQVVVVRFDDWGVLESVDVRSAEDGRNVRLVARETPTAGHEMTLLEQLIGNIGRFSGAVEGGDRLP